ncbi:hypothetical protein MD484_g5527, partial [Candolleomyces efflorescens]
MPSFSELKAKAASAASSGAEKLQNMKDRNTRWPQRTDEEDELGSVQWAGTAATPSSEIARKSEDKASGYLSSTAEPVWLKS